MAIELATAYVSLVAETSKLADGLKDAFSKVGKNAEEAGAKAGKDFTRAANKTAKVDPQVDTSKVEKKATKAGKSWQESFNKNSKSTPDVDTSKIDQKASQSGRDFISTFSKQAKAGSSALSGLEEKLKKFPVLEDFLGGVIQGMSSGLGSLGKIGDNATVKSLIATFDAIKYVPTVVKEVSTAFQPLITTLGTLKPKLSAIKTGVADVAAGFGLMRTYVQQANPSMSSLQVNMTALKNTATGLAQVGFSAVKNSIGGLVTALGGPLNIALMAATALFSDITSKNAASSAAVQGYAQAAQVAADAQTNLNDALLQSQGQMDGTAKAAVAQRIQAARGELNAASQSSASWLDQFRDPSGSLWGGFTKQIFDFGGASASNNLAFAKDMQADTAKKASEAIDSLKLSEQSLAQQVSGSQPIFDALIASLQKQGVGGTVAAEMLKQVREQILGAQAAGVTASPILTRLGEDVVQSAANIRTAFAGLPSNIPISIEAPGGDAVFELLQRLGVEVSTNAEKQIIVTAPMAQDVLDLLESLNIKVTTNNDKTITVTQTGAEDVGAAIDQAARDRTATITVLTNTAIEGVNAGTALGAGIPLKDLPKPAPSVPPKPKASGGSVFGPGTSTSDSIPALLSNGEHVLTAADVAAMGGQSAVYRFRRQLHGYEGGGEAGTGNFNPGMRIDTSIVDYPKPKLQRDLQAFGDRFNLWLTSIGLKPKPALKSTQELSQLPGWGYKQYPSSTPNKMSTGGEPIPVPDPNNPVPVPVVDPNTTVHGTGQGAPPGPQQPAEQTNYGMEFVRSLGFVPASAGNTSVAGTSSLAKFIGMGNDVVGGLIDTGTNLAQTAVSAAITGAAAAGSFGAGAAAAPAANAAASYGIQLAGQTAKRLSAYGFQMAGIAADALVEQLFPFGAPRWLGYDYTKFAPQFGIQQAFTSTIEKMGNDAINKAFPKPGQQQPGPGGNPNPAGPVNPALMPGAPTPPPPNPDGPPDLNASGPSQNAPLTNPSTNLMPDPLASLVPNPLTSLMPFDQGGMLAPGSMGINMTSRPEPVLTPQQWDAIAASSSTPVKNAPLVENLYAQDMQDAIRQLEKVKRRDMMQYNRV